MLRCTLAVLLLTLASGASAQAPWRAPVDGPSVSLDAFYGGTGGITLTNDRNELIGEGRADSYAAALSARVPVGARSSVVGSLPVTLYSARLGGTVDGGSVEQTSLDIGNLYVGFATRPVAEAEVEVGVWIPTSTGGDALSTDLDFVGFATDRENFEAYKTDVVSARLALRGETALGSVISLRGEIAPVLSYYIGDGLTDVRGQEISFPRTNTALTGALFTDLRLQALSFTLGALGRFEPRGGTEAYFDEVFASGLAMVTYEGSVRPSLGVRVPLQGTSVSDYVLHAGLSVALP